MTVVLMSVETVQNLKKDGNIGRRSNVNRKKMRTGEEMFMIPGMTGFI